MPLISPPLYATSTLISGCTDLSLPAYAVGANIPYKANYYAEIPNSSHDTFKINWQLDLIDLLNGCGVLKTDAQASVLNPGGSITPIPVENTFFNAPAGLYQFRASVTSQIQTSPGQFDDYKTLQSLETCVFKVGNPTITGGAAMVTGQSPSEQSLKPGFVTCGTDCYIWTLPDTRNKMEWTVVLTLFDLKTGVLVHRLAYNQQDLSASPAPVAAPQVVVTTLDQSSDYLLETDIFGAPTHPHSSDSLSSSSSSQSHDPCEKFRHYALQ